MVTVVLLLAIDIRTRQQKAASSHFLEQLETTCVRSQPSHVSGHRYASLCIRMLKCFYNHSNIPYIYGFVIRTSTCSLCFCDMR